MKRKSGERKEEVEEVEEKMGIEDVWCCRKELQDKEVYVVRHAQGQHNVSPSYDYDPPLTLEGHDQVTAGRQLTSQLEIDVVIVSPLRRTIQTAIGLFPAHDTANKMVALEELREVVSHSCNLRLDKPSLAKRFPNVDYSQVSSIADPYLKHFPISKEKMSTLTPKKILAAIAGADCEKPETEEEVLERANQVMAAIAARKEKRIALVSHCEFLYAFMGMQKVQGAPYGMYTFLENCQVKRLVYSDRGEWRSSSSSSSSESESV